MKYIFTTLLFLIILTQRVSAYTGTFAILPPFSSGVEHTSVTNYDIDTTGDNHQQININSILVERVDITTSSEQIGNLLIKEIKDSSSESFAITVPQKINDAVISATIYFWAPDIDAISIWHYHQNDPGVEIAATKVSPISTNSSGYVLWKVTTDSFSEFYINEPKKLNSFTLNVGIYITAVTLFSLSSLFVLGSKQNKS